MSIWGGYYDALIKAKGGRKFRRREGGKLSIHARSERMWRCLDDMQAKGKPKSFAFPVCQRSTGG